MRQQYFNHTARLNITLPQQTVTLIDRVWPKSSFGSRSAFINEASQWFAQHIQEKGVRKVLQSGYRASSQRDIELVSEWHHTSDVS